MSTTSNPVPISNPVPAPLTGVSGVVSTITADINSYLPLATEAILQVEATKQLATSHNKLATALGYILTFAKVGAQIPLPGVSAISSLVGMIDEIVAGFNSAGLFSHAPAPVAPTTVPVGTNFPLPVPSGTVPAAGAVSTTAPSTSASDPHSRIAMSFNERLHALLHGAE